MQAWLDGVLLPPDGVLPLAEVRLQPEDVRSMWRHVREVGCFGGVALRPWAIPFVHCDGAAVTCLRHDGVLTPIFRESSTLPKSCRRLEAADCCVRR